MDLGKFKTAHKVFGIIAILAAAAGVIATVGVVSLRTLNAASAQMKLDGNDEVLAALIGQSVQAMQNAAFHLAADSTTQRLNKAKADIAEQRTLLEKHLADAQQSAEGNGKRLLTDLQAAYKVYLVEIDTILRDAQSHVTDAPSAPNVVLDDANASEAEAAKLEQAVDAYIAHTSKLSDDLAIEAESTYGLASMEMIAVAVIGIVLGLGAGWIVSKNGIVSPIQRIVACLRALADGKLDTEVFGAGRADEVGDIARATQVFKDNLIAAERLRAQQEEERRRQAEAASRSARLTALTMPLSDEVTIDGSMPTPHRTRPPTAHSR